MKLGPRDKLTIGLVLAVVVCIAAVIFGGATLIFVEVFK